MVVALPLVLLITRSWLALVATAALCVLVLLLAQQIRLDVCEGGVVVAGFVSRRRYRWSDITAFSPMPLSTGKPGLSGSVVVAGVNHEILALGEPGLYEKLRELNGLLAQHRVSADESYVPSQPDDRRSDFTRRRLTLWLGPGAGWWPRRPPDTEADDRSASS